jgi:glucosamine--fructose-6-phosphate aminotransferase (isomerizing)
VAERFSTADFLHGPIAMVERSFPLFLFAPPGATWPSMKDVLRRLAPLNAEILLITDKRNKEALAVKGRALSVPAALGVRGAALEELYTPIPYIIPAQLFAASLADLKGIDPDRPRTLSKVTRTL